MCFGKLLRWGLWGLALGYSAVPDGSAATSVVRMLNYGFSPTNLVVRPGDSVLWSNTVTMPVHDTAYGFSNTPAALRLWSSSDLSFGQTFRFDFTNEGEYPYICKRHVITMPQGNPPTQTGLVLVTTLKLPPIINITGPTNGFVALNRANVPVTVSASDLDGSVRRVQYFLGPNPVATSTNPPFSVTLSTLFAGTQTLTARATDSDGLTTTSAPVVFTIRGRSNNVTVASFSFTPNLFPNSTVGDILVFNATAPSHTASTDSPLEPLCGSDFLVVGTPCRVVLSNAGVYPFFCIPHRSINMTGLVTVAGAPVITITSPTNTAILPEPGNFAVTADATKLGGSVTNVEFFANGVSLGAVTSMPFSVNASNLSAGNYLLTARAIDNVGFAGYATPVSVSVGTSLQLLSPVLVGNSFQFDLTTSPGVTYVLERSPQLPPAWSPFQTNTATGATLRVVEPISEASSTQMFYRAFIQP